MYLPQASQPPTERWSRSTRTNPRSERGYGKHMAFENRVLIIADLTLS